LNSQGTIRVLDDETISKIAAGEVIERPASVVKELIDNSIDAGASRIEIEIKDSGKSLIRVTDDGMGMNRDEAILSIQRHTTSKISSADDLFSIRTLGFRGEALPSISVISKFEMTTKPKGNATSGTILKVAGGKIEKEESIGCPAGTTIKVFDLFFNTPARKKYLKSNSTESSHINEVVSKYVLAYPEISFKLIQDGKEMIFSQGGGSFKDAFASVYGIDIAQNAVEVDYSSGYADVKGFVVRPTLTRIDRTLQSFFVNRRFVRNFLLARALEDAYSSLIMRDRHPIASLMIGIDPKEIDVNVHPAKLEIRFAKTNDVMQAIRSAVAQALGVKTGAPDKTYPAGSGFVKQNEWKPEMADVLFNALETRQVPFSEIEFKEGEEGLRPICQINNTYIIGSDGDGFVVVDQHAAHERMVYEEIKGQGKERISQKLLVPENLDVDQSDEEVLRENLEYLRGVGFDMEEFGRGTFIIRAVPAQIVKTSSIGAVMGIISEMKDLGRSVSLEEKKDALRKLVACHGAVRAGDKLSFDEMSSLLKRMPQTRNFSTCPHGRPTIVRFAKSDIEKMFKR